MHKFHDFDGSTFEVLNPKENPEKTMLGFKCYGAKQILENGGSDLLKTRYADYNLGDEMPGYDVVVSLDPEKKPKKVKASSGASEEEKAKVKEENAEIKLKLAELAAEVADTWCRFKSEFMGAPIRKALNDLQEENKETYLCKIPYRRHEVYWVRKLESTVMLFFSVHFTEATDIALAKIMCNELKDSKKISSQAVSVSYYSKIDMSSDIMSELSPDPKYCSVGIVSISINPIHVKKNFETACYFLTTFRQYIEYHIRMVKCLLHNRMRKRIGRFEIVFSKALREGVTKTAEYKTTIGGAQKSDKIEEEKISGLSKKAQREEHVIG